ncbi:hypothetical protein ABW20_dc0102169 [Dactylellina cionopaga]|nr:hypothetical protein ABW20_dc0102169 [Dactylellina cionopaga]
MELSNSVSFPGYGEQDTTFTPDETWPESNKYQVFILMDFGIKTLKSPNFGIWGGGKTSTSTLDASSTSSATRAAKTSPPSQITGAPSTTSGADEPSNTTSSASPSPTAAATTVSPTILAGAIGGAIAGTLAIVGLVWLMRNRMAESRAAHGSPNSNAGYPPPSYQNKVDNGGQPWSYQQMNAQSATSVNANNEFKGFAPVALNEMPTQMHQEPVEMYAGKERVELSGDSNWHIPPPPPPTHQQQQQSRYVYGPQSYGR